MLFLMIFGVWIALNIALVVGRLFVTRPRKVRIASHGRLVKS